MKSSNELPCLSSPPIDNNQIDCLSPATPNIIYSPLIYYDNQSTNENLNELSLNENQKTIANVNQNNSSQTPEMNFNMNNSIQSYKKNEIYYSENISFETNLPSLNNRNFQIEILTKIENIVSTANLDCHLNLREIALQLKNAEYNPKRFSALIIKLKVPKTTGLIFSNGRIVCLGAKTEETSKKACRKLAKILKSLNYKVSFKEFQIQNIVGSVDVKFKISLIKLYMYFLKNNTYKSMNLVIYEPDQFPGLIYRMIEPRIVLLIFVSGKIVLTGAKYRNDIYEGFKNIYPVLTKFKLESI